MVHLWRKSQPKALCEFCGQVGQSQFLDLPHFLELDASGSEDEWSWDHSACRSWLCCFPQNLHSRVSFFFSSQILLFRTNWIMGNSCFPYFFSSLSVSASGLCLFSLEFCASFGLASREFIFLIFLISQCFSCWVLFSPLKFCVFLRILHYGEFVYLSFLFFSVSCFWVTFVLFASLWFPESWGIHFPAPPYFISVSASGCSLCSSEGCVFLRIFSLGISVFGYLSYFSVF